MLLELALTSLLHVVPADTTTGTWQVQGDVSGFPVNHVCDVTVVDTALTGNCTASDGATFTITGQADGQSVKFQHFSDYEGQQITVIYTGTFQSPEEVRGSINVQPFDVDGYFTAKPVPPQPAAPAGE